MATKSTDLINPKLVSAIGIKQFKESAKLAKLVSFYDGLKGNAGDQLTIPIFSSNTMAADLTENTAMTVTDDAIGSVNITVKETGKAVAVTRKALLSSPIDLINEKSKQLGVAFSNKIDADILSQLDTETTNVVGDGTATVLSYDLLSQAYNFIGDKSIKGIIIAKEHIHDLLNDAKFTAKRDVINGVESIGVIMGAPVFVASNSSSKAFVLTENNVAGAYKKELTIEKDYDALAREHIIAGTMYYGISYVGGAVKISLA